MDINEFLVKANETSEKANKETDEATEALEMSANDGEEISPENNIDIQKAVVESLAADKAIQDETIAGLKATNENLKRENETSAVKIKALTEELEEIRSVVARLKTEFAKVGDILANNVDNALTSNRIALLDRDLEVPDRFEGETRDHVLEVLAEARERSEKEGRLRRAQLLESVLVANESTGNLSKQRHELYKLFVDNGNIISGPVLTKLQILGISHKNGEEYLLPNEIINRNY